MINNQLNFNRGCGNRNSHSHNTYGTKSYSCGKGGKGAKGGKGGKGANYGKGKGYKSNGIHKRRANRSMPYQKNSYDDISFNMDEVRIRLCNLRKVKNLKNNTSSLSWKDFFKHLTNILKEKVKNCKISNGSEIMLSMAWKDDFCYLKFKHQNDAHNFKTYINENELDGNKVYAEFSTSKKQIDPERYKYFDSEGFSFSEGSGFTKWTLNLTFLQTNSYDILRELDTAEAIVKQTLSSPNISDVIRLEKAIASTHGKIDIMRQAIANLLLAKAKLYMLEFCESEIFTEQIYREYTNAVEYLKLLKKQFPPS